MKPFGAHARVALLTAALAAIGSCVAEAALGKPNIVREPRASEDGSNA